MIGLNTIAKLAKVSMGPSDLAELFSALGWKVNFQQLQEGQRPYAFQRAATAAVQPGSACMSIHGVDKDGSLIDALLILSPPAAAEKSA